MTLADYFAVLGGVGGLLALQAWWMGRSLDQLAERLDQRIDHAHAMLDARLDRTQQDLERFAEALGRGLAEADQRTSQVSERVARLEGGGS